MGEGATVEMTLTAARGNHIFIDIEVNIFFLYIHFYIGSDPLAAPMAGAIGAFIIVIFIIISILLILLR